MNVCLCLRPWYIIFVYFFIFIFGQIIYSKVLDRHSNVYICNSRRVINAMETESICTQKYSISLLLCIKKRSQFLFVCILCKLKTKNVFNFITFFSSSFSWLSQDTWKIVPTICIVRIILSTLLYICMNSVLLGG